MTLTQLRERCEEIQGEYERQRGNLYRRDGQPVYGPAEHEERLRGLQRVRSEQLDVVVEEVQQVVTEAEREVAALEDGDISTFLSSEEITVAAARKPFTDELVRAMSEEELVARLRTVLNGGDRAAVYAHRHAAAARGADVHNEDLDGILLSMRDLLAGPERVARVEKARATVAEASDVQMLARHLKVGARTASGAWLNRRSRSVR